MRYSEKEDIPQKLLRKCGKDDYSEKKGVASF